MTSIKKIQMGSIANDIVPGILTVGTSATQLSSTYTDCLGVEIQVDSGNSGTIYRGDSEVTTEIGIQLYSGAVYYIGLRDLSKLYFISDTADQKIRYIIYT